MQALIVDKPKNLEKVLETVENFEGDAHVVEESVQIEFDSDFSHMLNALMNALMNQGENVRQA